MKKENLKKELLKKYSEEETEKFIEFVQPFYDFYDFMLEEHNMSFEDVEKESSKFSEEVFIEYLEKMDSENPLEYVLEISGDIMKRYAEDKGYPEGEKVKTSMTKYMEFLIKNNLDNGHQ